MRARAALLVLAALAAASGSVAEAPTRSLIPQPRPGPVLAAPAVPVAPAASPGLTRVAVAASAYAPSRSPRPAPRPGGTPVPPAALADSVQAALAAAEAGPAPDGGGAAAPAVPPALAVATAVPEPPRRPGFLGGLLRPRGDTGAAAVARSPRPGMRPDGLEQRVRAAATRATPARVAQPGTRGGLCGSPGLVGERLDTITGRISGCGIAQPVRLREVDGIALTQPATINCDTARALQEWVREGVMPIVGRRGGGVDNLRVVASYACRTRNSQPGARLSEHARGNAIDIAGIGLANGSELTVLGGWRGGTSGPLLRRMHQAACGTFGTVLGPDSDRFHQDHFHLDTASYRAGAYCR